MMTSLEIAELTGKQHNHLMRDIRNMERAWEKVTQSRFGLSTYKDSTGRTLPCYQLTKTECLYIATKFNDEARAKLVLRWEELDGNIPSGVVVENLKRLRVLAAFRRETTGKPPQGWFSESLKRKNPRSSLGGDSCYCSHNGVCPRCEIGCGMRLNSASLQSLRNNQLVRI